MTRIDADRLVFANYRNIYVFEPERRIAKPVTPTGSLPVWAPTAVFYSAYYDRLFIANYNGGDVIVGSLRHDGDDWHFEVDERLTHPDGIKGPEGVFVSPGGRYMALADYDGNAVSLFERVDGRWEYRWRSDLTGAHGVTIVGDHLYGAGAKAIVKVDLQTGREVQRITNVGPHAILFATCLNFDEITNALIGSDTMAGRVFRLTRDLEMIESFGVNGPTHSNLSMPYCAYQEGDATYVLSAYQDRIIRISDSGTESYDFGGRRREYVDSQPSFRYRPEMWRGLVLADHPAQTMFGQRVSPSYGTLLAADGTNLIMPGPYSVLGPGWLYYKVSVARHGDWSVIAANSSPAVLLYNHKTDALGMASTGEWDCWAIDQSLMCPSRKYTVAELLAAGKVAESGKNLEEIAKSLEVSLDKLLDELKSSGGMKLRAALSSDPSQAADEYLRWTAGQDVPLVEYWLAQSIRKGSRLPAR